MSRLNQLIIDELGFVPLSRTGAELLFEVFSQRYERGSTLITTNLPFDEWTEVFGSERLTGALLDRLTHLVHILEINGESYRFKRSRESAVIPGSGRPGQRLTRSTTQSASSCLLTSVTQLTHLSGQLPQLLRWSTIPPPQWPTLPPPLTASAATTGILQNKGSGRQPAGRRKWGPWDRWLLVAGERKCRRSIVAPSLTEREH